MVKKISIGVFFTLVCFLSTMICEATVCLDDQSFWCVERGDRSLVIASSASVSWDEFVKMNPGVDLESIKPGQRLRIVSQEKILGEKIKKLQEEIRGELFKEKESSSNRIGQLQAEIDSLNSSVIYHEQIRRDFWFIIACALFLSPLLIWHQIFIRKRRKTEIHLRIGDEIYLMKKHQVNWKGELVALHIKNGKRMAYNIGKKDLYAKSMISSLKRDNALLSSYLYDGWLMKIENENNKVVSLEKRRMS